MIEKVKNTIDRYALIEQGDKVTVGLSGGADSVTLISVLCRLKDEYNLTVSAVHVNHGIRGDEAERDEAFVSDFCRSLNIPLTVFHRNIPLEAKENGESEEECGRRVRYECFEKVANGGKIATAHTLSDSIETMLFNMLRGSSAAGLCSIPVKRENIIRPLIDCTRDQIEDYCEKNGLSFVTDSTNLETEYTRNYIRREIMPMFSRVNESYISSLARLKEFISEDNAYLQSQAQALLTLSRKNRGIDVASLLKGDKVLIKRALIGYIKEECGIRPESRHINLLFEKLNENFTLQLNARYYVCIKDGTLFIKRKNDKAVSKPEKIPLVEGDNYFGEYIVTAHIVSNEVFLNNSPQLLENAIDYDKIKGNLFIRGREEGDRLLLYKRKVTKSIKKLFCEMKIPPEKRERIPLISDDNNVVWVCGAGVNAEFAVGKNTERILILKTETLEKNGG